MSLSEYLQAHFVEKSTFASLAGISSERLDQLLAAEAIPSATYTCDGESVSSAAFGTTEIRENLTGRYFRPECVRWATVAATAQPGWARAAVLAELTKELRVALQDYVGDSTAIEEKIESFLPYFWDGTLPLRCRSILWRWHRKKGNAPGKADGAHRKRK